jgi:transposase
MDSLQTVMAEILTINDYQNKPNIKGYLKKCFFNRVVDEIRHETTYEIFKKDFSEYCQDSSHGVTKIYFNEMILNIKQVLLVSEFEIFKLYHVAGMSSEKIAKKLDYCQKTIINRVKTINDKIEDLHFKNCFDNRYVSHFSGKKKRQHKRKIMTKKEIIELSGMPYDIAIDDYSKQAELVRYNLDLEKLPYSQAHGIKDIMIDKSSYHTIANGNFVYNQVNHVIQNVYSNSCILPISEVKEKRHITYRKKRYARKYQNSLRKFKVDDKIDNSLTLKNGRYLQYLTD